MCGRFTLFTDFESLIFGAAGLWESWKNPNGQTIHSCTIVGLK